MDQIIPFFPGPSQINCRIIQANNLKFVEEKIGGRIHYLLYIGRFANP